MTFLPHRGRHHSAAMKKISAENLKIVIQDLKEAFKQGKGRAMVVEVKGRVIGSVRDRLYG